MSQELLDFRPRDPHAVLHGHHNPQLAVIEAARDIYIRWDAIVQGDLLRHLLPNSADRDQAQLLLSTISVNYELLGRQLAGELDPETVNPAAVFELAYGGMWTAWQQLMILLGSEDLSEQIQEA